ncbi:hypothetical protein IFM89_003944 [Coptis chinensis]|uniref:Pentatricopeptide repeat-containing protein n=1 Tax=Coptis chinensis TaxID=261450 RepID=A0A835H2E9_9MAGN|nr:hypothetical protein IFM89_003944 [Coptis chinensis]
MVKEYQIEPEVDHYGCIVDLFALAGIIKEALDHISLMSVKPDVVIWRSLLDACCKQNVSIELSEEVAKRILDTNGGASSGVYVLLSRVYASANRWNDVGLVLWLSRVALLRQKSYLIIWRRSVSMVDMSGVIDCLLLWCGGQHVMLSVGGGGRNGVLTVGLV